MFSGGVTIQLTQNVRNHQLSIQNTCIVIHLHLNAKGKFPPTYINSRVVRSERTLSREFSFIKLLLPLIFTVCVCMKNFIMLIFKRHSINEGGYYHYYYCYYYF